MSTKYVVTTELGEIVYGPDGLRHSKRDATRLAKEMVNSDYGKIKIYKAILIEEVTKSKPKINKK